MAVKKKLAAKDTEATLQQRAQTHGDFREVARVAQNLKEVLKDSPNWDNLSATQKEVLEMNASKTARILCGDADEADHWHDICGYSKLEELKLINEN